MPTFDDSTTTAAPPEEVWKVLYDPTRFPEWWQGVATIEAGGHDGKGDFTMYPDGYPDFPMPQELRTDRDGGRVTISCLVSDIVFEWRLEAAGDAGDGTRIGVHVEIPDAEAHRLDGQRDVVAASLRALATLAAAGATDAPPARG
jgi:uncharacterized protein YndB with AHSA1/START domain